MRRSEADFCQQSPHQGCEGARRPTESKKLSEEQKRKLEANRREAEHRKAAKKAAEGPRALPTLSLDAGLDDEPYEEDLSGEGSTFVASRDNKRLLKAPGPLEEEALPGLKVAKTAAGTSPAEARVAAVLARVRAKEAARQCGVLTGKLRIISIAKGTVCVRYVGK